MTSEPTPCRICGDVEPSHGHLGDQRIDNYFTVGRGQTEMDAAREWQRRYQVVTAELAAEKERLLHVEQQRARLREALAAIRDWPTVVPDHPHGGVHPPYIPWNDVRRIWEKALANTAPAEPRDGEPSIYYEGEPQP